MEQQPYKPGCKTFLDYFEKLAADYPNDDYLGTRAKVAKVDAEGKTNITYGDYQWKSFKEVETIVQNLARGMHKLGLPNLSYNDDGTPFKFIGVWSKNRWEWLATHIANMYFKYTTIGFFDSMGV